MRSEEFFPLLPMIIQNCLRSKNGDYIVYVVRAGQLKKWASMMLLLGLKRSGEYYKNEAERIVSAAEWCNVRSLYNHINKTDHKPPPITGTVVAENTDNQHRADFKGGNPG